MPIKIYLDENMASKELTRLLQQGRFEVITPADAGLVGQDDATHLAYAVRHGLILMTKNPADFLELHMKNSAHGGIVGIYQDNDVRKDMCYREIVAVLSKLVGENFSFKGRFIVLNHYRIKGKRS